MDPHLLLALAEGCEPGLVPALLDPSRAPEELLSSPPAELPPRVLRRLLDPQLRARAEAMLRRAEQAGLHCLGPRDPRYPPALRELPLRPNLLFARGDTAALQRLPAIAVVGSRTPTAYGLDAASTFAAALAGAGAVIWSGLARGVDALAHRAALDAGCPTVAVLAGGLDAIYPPEHTELAAAIAASGGCLLSELPPGRRAQRGHFPRRNRILAAAGNVLVVEAGVSSGALHTARFAAQHGATTWAIPGPWSSERSQGCHRLLQEGALVAADPSELLRDLGLQAELPAATALQLQLSADDQALLACLQSGPRPADLVQRESGLDREHFLPARLRLDQAPAMVDEVGDAPLHFLAGQLRGRQLRRQTGDHRLDQGDVVAQPHQLLVAQALEEPVRERFRHELATAAVLPLPRSGPARAHAAVELAAAALAVAGVAAQLRRAVGVPGTRLRPASLLGSRLLHGVASTYCPHALAIVRRCCHCPTCFCQNAACANGRPL